MRTFLLTLLLALSPCAARASIIIVFNMNTAPLVGHPAGPFSLDFQLIDGSGAGDGNNTAILDQFTYGGGSATGSPVLTSGASGDANSSIQITDTEFFNEFQQTFIPGSQLSFRLNLSTNVDSGGTPDTFTFAILDSGGVSLPTQSFFDVFVEIDIDSSNPAVQTFPSDPNRSPAAGGPAISIDAPTADLVVPEPKTILLILVALLTLIWRCATSKWRNVAT